MAGMPPTNQPYGQQYQPMPQYAPATGRQPGSVAPKVWGIILLVLGILGVIMLMISLASLGGGMTGSSFSNTSTSTQAEMDKLSEAMVRDSMARWSFWLYHAIEVVIVAMSLVAGFCLA